MKRNVTIRVEADIPDSVCLTDVAAQGLKILSNALLAHSRDLEDPECEIGQSGHTEYQVNGWPVQVSWEAGYGTIAEPSDKPVAGEPEGA